MFQDPLLYHDLITPSEEEEDGADQLFQVLNAYAGEPYGAGRKGGCSCKNGTLLPEVIPHSPLAYSGSLGVDGINRKFYILNGASGEVLAGSGGANDSGEDLISTPNLAAALRSPRRRPLPPSPSSPGGSSPPPPRGNLTHEASF